MTNTKSNNNEPCNEGSNSNKPAAPSVSTGARVGQGVLIVLGLIFIAIGIAMWFYIRDRVRNGLKDAFIVDSPDHKNYEDFLDDRESDDRALYYRYYIWNMTNPNEWASGAEKAKFAEVGPFTYRSYYDLKNVTFGDDGNEISYYSRDTYEFQRDQSVADDETTVVFNVNPFYVAAVASAGGSESVLDLSLAASAFQGFTTADAADFGASVTKVDATGRVPGFARAYANTTTGAPTVTLTPQEAGVALAAFPGNVQALAGFAQYVTAYTTAALTGDTTTAAGAAAFLDSNFPNGPDFRDLDYNGGTDSKATLFAKYAAQVGASVRSSFVAAGAGANGGLLFRKVSAKAYIWGPDPLYATLRSGASVGFQTNHTLPEQMTALNTIRTGKKNKKEMGLDYYIQKDGITTSTAYQNAAGEGPTVVVNGRTQSLDFWGSKKNAPATAEIYFSTLERYITFIKQGATEYKDIDTMRYKADIDGELTPGNWNVTYQGYAPLAYWASGVPLFVSAPCQQFTQAPYNTAVHPDSWNYVPEIHDTFLDFEMMTGLPMNAKQSVQFNLQMNFTQNSYQDAPNPSEKDIMVPMFWFTKEHQVLDESANKLRYIVKTVPMMRKAILGCLAGVGAAMVLIGLVWALKPASEEETAASSAPACEKEMQQKDADNCSVKSSGSSNCNA